MNVIEIITSDSKKILKERLESKDDIQCVMIIELHKGGGVKLSSSKASMRDVSYMIQYANHTISKWFSNEELV